MLEDVRLTAIHQLHIILGQLERRLFETEVSWWTWNYETEVDVNDVPVNIYQDVIVVPILDFKQVLYNRIPCQTLHKV